MIETIVIESCIYDESSIMYVGQSAEEVRAVFKKARQDQQCTSGVRVAVWYDGVVCSEAYYNIVARLWIGDDRAIAICDPGGECSS